MHELSVMTHNQHKEKHTVSGANVQQHPVLQFDWNRAALLCLQIPELVQQHMIYSKERNHAMLNFSLNSLH